MRILVALTLFTTACISGVPESGPPQYDSVHERMSAIPTWLFIHDDTSSGTLSARRGHDGRTATTTPLMLDRGYVRTVIDDSGQLTIDQLELAVAPFTMDRMFDKPTRLQNVLLRLTEPVRASVAWTSDDNASATLPMAFDVGWALVLDGGDPIPMATQRLPRESVQLELSGTGDHIEASLTVDATGELWSCDDVEVTQVTLSLHAEAAD
jgi:hypothetical protein